MGKYDNLGKDRKDLGKLKRGKEVRLIVKDNGYYGTKGTRVTRIDNSGQEWVKLNDKYWKYPEQVET